MNLMKMKNALVVYKKSSYELYRNSPDEDVRKFLEGNDPDAKEMLRSHEAQKRTLDIVVSELERLGVKYDTIYRADLKPVKDYDYVISVGGDGTFLEVSHYVEDIPIIGVNSDPERSTGHYCCSDYRNLGDVLRNIEKAPRTKANRFELKIDGKKLPEPVLNEVLCAHANPAAVMKYRLEDGEGSQECWGSGLLACTAAGSTGFMYEEGGDVMPLDSEQIQYITRSRRQEMPHFADELKVTSLTRQGKIYVDGSHLIYGFGLGAVLEIKSGKPVTIIGNLEEKRQQYLSKDLKKN